MFMYLQKNKKGFTLIELMVVVAIIGVLALLGLRLYTGQQNKAKEAIVKANASTVHTLIQSDLADKAVTLDATYQGKLADANLRNPFTGEEMEDSDFIISGTNGEAGQIIINEDGNDGTKFIIWGIGADGSIPEELTAQR